MAGHKVDFAALGWNTWPGEALGRVKVDRAAGRQVRLIELGPGFVEPEECVRGHIVYVVSGRYMQQVEGETWEMQAGQALILPPGTPHRSRNTGAVAAVVFVVDLDGSDQGAGAATTATASASTAPTTASTTDDEASA
jgi:quercetin dioxygenase-like cupin family protein